MTFVVAPSSAGRGILLHAASVAVMAAAPLLNKFGLLAGISPAWASLANAVIAAGCCLLFATVVGQRVRLVADRTLSLIAVTNAVGIVLVYEAVDRLLPAEVGFLGRFYLVFAVILAAVFGGERLGRLGLLCLAGVLLGGAMLLGPPDEISNYVGAACALGFAAMFALTNFLVKTRAGHLPSNTTLLSVNVLSAVLLLPYVLAVDPGGHAGLFQWSAIGWVALAAFANGFLGILLYYEGLKFTTFNQANVIRSVGPVVTMLYAWPFFPMVLDSFTVAGMSLLVVSAGILSLRPK